MKILILVSCILLVCLTVYGEDEELKRLVEEAKKEAELAEASKVSEKAPPEQPQMLNPRIMVCGDFIGRLDDPDAFAHGKEIGDRFSLRGLGLDFRADVDPYAKAVAIIGFHEHAPGDYHTHAEEVYLDFLRLPHSLGLRVGKFKSHFGLMNTLHEHDYPQTTAPRSYHTFLSHHGLTTTGFALTYLTPFNGTSVRLEVTNGENKHLLAGEDSDDLALIGRITLPFDVGDTGFFQVGLNALSGYNDPEGRYRTDAYALDLLFRWRPPRRGLYRSVVAQLELYYADKDRETTVETTHPEGGFCFVQFQMGRRWFVGLRFEYAESPENDKEVFWGAALYLSYYTTHFLRLRIGVEHYEDFIKTDTLEFENRRNSLFVQATFLFGAHPPHPYWVVQ